MKKKHLFEGLPALPVNSELDPVNLAGLPTLPCACGEITGERCSATDSDATTYYMPEWLRSSHEAAGNAGTWPANGSIKLRVVVAHVEDFADVADGWLTVESD